MPPLQGTGRCCLIKKIMKIIITVKIITIIIMIAIIIKNNNNNNNYNSVTKNRSFPHHRFTHISPSFSKVHPFHSSLPTHPFPQNLWTRCVMDEGRPEVPSTADFDTNLPRGTALITSVCAPFLKGEERGGGFG